MKRTYYKSGDWNAICDRCGRKYKASQLKKTWDNLYMCSKHYEERHIADFFRGRSDDQSVPWNRPEAGDGYVNSCIYVNGGYADPTYVIFTEAECDAL